MVTIIGIILVDVLILMLFIYFYRQELGLTSAGSIDKPVLRSKPAGNKAARIGSAADQAKGGQMVPSGSAAGRRAGRRNPQKT